MELVIVAGAIALIVVLYFITTYYQKQEEKRHRPNPALDTVNTTNYNIRRVEEEELKGLDPEEAARLVDNWQRTGYIPSHREFYTIQRILRRDAKEKLHRLQESW